jgi:hypothetical protein
VAGQVTQRGFQESWGEGLNHRNIPVAPEVGGVQREYARHSVGNRDGCKARIEHFDTLYLVIVHEALPFRVYARAIRRIFHGLGMALFIEREFARSEDIPGGAQVAILSYGLWQRLLGRVGCVRSHA